MIWNAEILLPERQNLYILDTWLGHARGSIY